MKIKIIALITILAMVLVLPACGSTAESSNESEPVEETESLEASETPSEEPTDAAVEEISAEPVTVEFEGISFTLPADVEYTETDSEVLNITFEPQQRVCVITIIDTSSFSEIFEDDTSALNKIAIGTLLSYYDDVQNETTSTVEIAGVTGAYEVATVKVSGSWTSMVVVAFTNPDTMIQYAFTYGVTTSAEGDNSDFYDFIESVAFTK